MCVQPMTISRPHHWGYLRGWGVGSFCRGTLNTGAGRGLTFGERLGKGERGMAR